MQNFTARLGFGASKWPWLIPVLALFIFLSFNANRYPAKLIWSDMEGYYLYLPCVFVSHSFDLDKATVVDKSYFQAFPGTNKLYSKYTCGVALLEAPFFLVAHALAGPLGYPRDGHSVIYCIGLMMAGVFYALLGLLLLRSVLRRHYPDWAATLSVLGLFFGTNAYYYTFFQPSMSHVFSFSLSACLVWLTPKVWPADACKWRYAMGLVLAMLVLIRPTNVIMALYPLFFWFFFEKKPSGGLLPDWTWKDYALLLLIALLVCSPQLFYWKHTTGQWVLFSYTQEGFDYWKAPKIGKVLFGAWNGWLLYSPIAALPLLRICWGLRRNALGERGLLLMFALATYAFGSWWAWWFGGAFGHRCFVEYLPFLAAPFAAMWLACRPKRPLLIAFSVLCAFLVYYNLGLTYHYHAPWDGFDWDYEDVWREVKGLF